MRLLQWFYFDQLEATDRISSETIAANVIETALAVTLIQSSDTFLVGADSSLTNPPIEIVQIVASDTLTIEVGEGSLAEPYLVPPGTGFYAIGAIEQSLVFCSLEEPAQDSTAFGLIETSEVFKGDFSGVASESIVLQLDDAARLPIISFVEAVDAIGLAITEEQKIINAFASSETVPIQSLNTSLLLILLGSQESFVVVLEESALSFAAYRGSDQLAVQAVPLEIIYSILTIADGLIFGIDDAGIINIEAVGVSESLVLGWEEVVTPIVYLQSAEFTNIGLGGASSSLYNPLLSLGDILILTAVEGESQLDITIFAEPDAPEPLAGFPGLQATWDEDPYMSLT
jgi:hypothetical protein